LFSPQAGQAVYHNNQQLPVRFQRGFRRMILFKVKTGMPDFGAKAATIASALALPADGATTAFVPGHRREAA
jgi:hypothetical protein